MDSKRGPVLVAVTHLRGRRVVAELVNPEDSIGCFYFYPGEFKRAKVPYPTKIGERFWVQYDREKGATLPAPAAPAVPDRLTVTVDGRSVTFPIGATVRVDADGTIHIYTEKQ